jgi:hypothetical protein
MLTFDIMSQYDEETSFNVSVTTPWFSGPAPSSTFMVNSLADMFREMAGEWQGWKKAKSWEDLERRVSLSASMDSTGHISLAVELQGPDYASCLRVVLKYEAGQLEEMANELSHLFV